MCVHPRNNDIIFEVLKVVTHPHHHQRAEEGEEEEEEYSLADFSKPPLRKYVFFSHFGS